MDDYNDQMMHIGYNPRGEQGITGRRYYSKGGDNRTHHVHIYEAGNRNVEQHLHFKHYLLSHPEEASAYGQLKLSLIRQSSEPQSYQNGKESFCNEIMKRAMEWAAKRIR